MLLPFTFQAGGPGKRCPAIALPHRQCLSRSSRKCIFFPRSVLLLAGCIPTIGKELAEVLPILILLEGRGFLYGREVTLSHAAGYSWRWGWPEVPVSLPCSLLRWASCGEEWT